jgi:signal transduction histidine kinase/DNA-binding response OmpR family regulator
MFKLVRYFTVSAAVVFAVSSVFAAAIFSAVKVSSLLTAAHESNAQVATKISNQFRYNYATLLLETGPAAATHLKSRWETTDMHLVVVPLIQRSDVKKVQVHRRDGTLIYSSDLTEIGAEGLSKPHVGLATPPVSQNVADLAQSKLATTDNPSYMGTQPEVRDMVVTSMPMINANGMFYGTVSILRDVSAAKSQIGQDVLHLLVFGCIACGLLLVCLYFIVQHAEDVLIRQYRELDSFNTRLEGGVAQRTARLVKQQDAISAVMNSPAFRSGALGDAVGALTEAAANLLDVERGSVWLLDDAKTTLKAIDVMDRRTGIHTRDVELPYAHYANYFGTILSEKVAFINDTATDTQEFSTHAAYARGLGIRSTLDAPIIVDGKVAGAFCLRKCDAPRTWTAEDRLVVVAFASLAAVALERDRHAQLEAKVVLASATLLTHQNRLVELTGDERFKSGNQSDALRLLTKTLAEMLGADRCGIWLLNKTNDAKQNVELYDAETEGFGSVAPISAVDFPEHFKRLGAGEVVAITDYRANIDALKYRGRNPDLVLPQSALWCPIMVGGVVIGNVSVGATKAQISWAPEHQLLATSVANLAALVFERIERARIEAELRIANVAALAANKAKGEFLANMSHEIRTPMNGVFGMADLLMQTTLSHRQQRLVGSINQSAKTLLTIINDILDFSRIEAGKLELDAREFDTRHCLEGALDLFADEVQRKGIELSLFVDDAVPDQLVGDAGRVRQICVNLIGNAIKFTSSGEVAVDVTMTPRGVQVVVRDTGIGIDAVGLERLFKSFSQADSSISRKFGGTGLGLVISQHLVQMMGGTIGIESKKGSGTTVTVVLPLPVGTSQRLVSIAGHKALNGAHILVVDDRAINREIISSYLKGAGAIVTVSDGASSALNQLDFALAADRPFGAAVIDMIMPGTDGLQLARRIRDKLQLASLPLVMATSLSWQGDARAARALGFSEFLTKPVRRRELLDIMARVLTPASATAGTDERVNPRIEPDQKFSARVLVAEDNLVNQEVVLEYLTSLGCSVSLANNGLEAVELFKSAVFDLIVMDCQMPEMDGLTATRHIRSDETARQLKRTPIVAMTANAFAEDRTACLQSGMDDYMSKPYTEDQLVAMLTRWIGATAGHADRPAALIPPTSILEAPMSALDAVFVNGLREKRPQLWTRMVSAYLTHTPKTMADIEAARHSAQVAALRMATHSLKSSSANVGAMRLAELARGIEALSKDETLDQAIAAIDGLVAEYQAVEAALRLEFAKAG